MDCKPLALEDSVGTMRLRSVARTVGLYSHHRIDHNAFKGEVLCSRFLSIAV